MSDLISREPLYKRAVELEGQALDYIGKLNESEADKFSEEWKIWSLILAERIAFKHDVADAPTVEKRKKGKWRLWDGPNWYRCSECGAVRRQVAFMEYYCPNCGADMRGEEDGERKQIHDQS